MKSVVIDGINWPIPDPEDFVTEHLDETFPLFEDENGDGFFGYGHIPEGEFLQQVNRYLRHMDVVRLEDGELEESSEVRHVYAKVTDKDAEDWRFSWSDVTADTPHAFPLTLIEW